MDEQLSTATVWPIPSLRLRLGRIRVIRPWQRSGRWSPEQAAAELHRRRAELIGQLRRRSEGRGIPAGAQEEIVDDAITAVVMAPRGVANEHHLLGAFWLAVDHRCRRHREGRHLTRLGSRRRVAFELATQETLVADNPFDALELRERLARAADLIADLNTREREVISVIASRGVGPVSAARLLGLPLGEVRSAARSANAKLDRIAAIYAAGRMCQFRAGAIAADAAGGASEREVRLARAHVSACVPCGMVYRRLRREMRRREFQRASAAAFLPVPAISVAHVGGVGRIAIWIEQRISFVPRGSGDRAAEVLGGAGIAKAAVAGTAIVAAGGALTGPVLRALEHAPAHQHRAQIGGRAHGGSARAVSIGAASQMPTPSSGTAKEAAMVAVHTSPKVPSKSLGYLAVGGPPTDSHSSPPSSETSGRERSARAASVAGPPAGAEETAVPSSGRSLSPPTQSGGGSSLGYLGR